MKSIFTSRAAVLSALFFGAAASHAELTQLEDDSLSSISGQSGITLDLGLSMSVGEIAYFDDDNGLLIKGFKVGSTTNQPGGAAHRFDVDIDADGALAIQYDVRDRRVEVADIFLSDNAVNSMGGFFFDHDATGSFRVKADPVVANRYVYDFTMSLSNGRFGYRTNGNEVFMDDVSLDLTALGVSLDVIPQGLGITTPHLIGAYNVGAIRYSNNPLNHGVSEDVGSGVFLPSYGGISGDFDLTSYLEFGGGGRVGAEGIHIESQTTINSANFIYSDDGNQLAFLDITGNYQYRNLNIDVAPDHIGRLGLGFTYDQLVGRIDIGKVMIGAAGSLKTFGGLSYSFDFSEQVVDGKTYTNAVFLQGGGHADAGYQGLRMATTYSLANADISYIDDGNRLIISGLQAWGQGDVTVNVTRAGMLGGTEFFDGVRIGFEDFSGGYKISGIRVGDESQPLQGGTELLLALGVYPAYDFTVNGHITLGAGGASGEGITVNSDIHITDGRAAMLADENGSGLWMSDLDYDMHVRNMTVDVTPDGLAIVSGESWSTMDIGNLRVGDKVAGGSFGRVVLQRYELGSSMTLSAGGAGQVCVGASGGSQAACEAGGGIWEDRGTEGITISLKSIFAQAISETKRNRLTWETNRQTDGSGRAINNSGMKLVIDNFYTSDGVDADGDGVEDNTFGMRNELAIDIYRTKVVKKADGADSNGVSGSRGDEKIMDVASAAGYRYVSAPSAADIANRPLGMAVQSHIQFKELSIGNVDLVHPVGGASTMLYGAKIQNVDLRSNLTATPIQ